MLDFFERGFLATVGVLSMTREKSQEMVDQLVQRGELNQSESKQMVERLVRRGQEEQDRLRDLVRQEVSTVMRDLNIATRADIEALNSRIDALLEKLEGQKEG